MQIQFFWHLHFDNFKAVITFWLASLVTKGTNKWLEIYSDVVFLQHRQYSSNEKPFKNFNNAQLYFYTCASCIGSPITAKYEVCTMQWHVWNSGIDCCTIQSTSYSYQIQ